MLAAEPVIEHNRYSLEELIEAEVRIAKLRGYTFKYIIMHYSEKNIQAIKEYKYHLKHICGLYTIKIERICKPYLTIEAQWKKEQ